METPHHSGRARLPSIRISGQIVESGKTRSSKGTPLVGETVSVFRHNIELIGVDTTSARTIDAIVDTGASFLTAPQTILRELGVVADERIPLRLADGSVVERDLGEVRVRIMGRTATTAVIFGTDSDHTLLGSHALEAVRLAVDPWGQRLVDFTPYL